MKYVLIGDNNKNDIKKQILKNRGVNDISKYLNLNCDCEHDYNKLENINIVVQKIKIAIEQNIHIKIVIDSDVDGVVSASSLYHYMKNKLDYKNISFVMHTGKQHGLSNDILNQIDVNEPCMILIPDASTNDKLECNMLKELGFEIIILDHHLKEVENPSALIVNNQIGKYPNKNLCGVGVVYKLLQALDEEFWIDESFNYIDLVALGNISDVMDLRECETRYLVDLGLKNINNSLFKALLEKQSFSIKDILNPTITDIAFYITPLINALIRLGTQEEKTMMFKAFCEEYEEYDYTPRKTKNNPNPQTIKENIYNRIARICANTKQKQARLQEKAVKEVVEVFDESNKVNSICFINATKLESLTNELSGLAAIKIADKYNKPCLVLRKESNSKDVFSGSARNIRDGEIENLKEVLSSSRLFKKTVGHENAFGVSIMKENIPIAIQYFNKKFKTEQEKCYRVDFIYDNFISYKDIKEIYSLKDLYCSFIEEPRLLITNLECDLIGFECKSTEKGSKRWYFQNRETEFIKFNVDENDEMISIDDFEYEKVYLNVIGRVTINTYNNIVKPQFVIEDYEIIDKE